MEAVPNISIIISQVHDVYKEAHRGGVPAVSEWPLMDSPNTTLIMTSAYLVFSWWLGPLIMKNRDPLQLRQPMLVYNLAMFLLNFYILHEFITGAIGAGYTFPCTHFVASKDPSHLKIASAVWWYFFSKLIEFMDTIFFILRKRDRQVSFLHVYHHASMPVLWWACTKWVPGGQSVYGAAFNSFVHVLMYFYYAVSALGPEYQKYVWWKRYLTQLQLIQFVYAMWLCVYSWYTECRFVNALYLVFFLQTFSFLLLFLNFYIREYILKAKVKKTKES